MTERSVEHDTFTLERNYGAAPPKVFAAWADPAAKARWFRGPEEWEAGPYELDFRVGGREVSSGGPQGGPVHTYNAVYLDIVPDTRIIYAYDMYMDETRISVSLATVQLEPVATGTRLTLTEHGAFLDGLDFAAQRKQGTGSLLDALGQALQAGTA
jgi:uncharacterized protein YndB with AHSA1/START domain